MFGGRLKYIRAYIGLFLIGAIVIGLDQWTKMLVRSNLSFGETWMPIDWLAPYARIVYWHNTGSAFGLFQGYGQVFAALAVIVAGVIVYYYPKIDPADWWLRLALGLQMGGALGNLIDRLTVGKVTDFVSVGTFAVFNVADASITCGVGVLLLGAYLKERADQKLKHAVVAKQTPGEGSHSE
jgi:signal peptidase II